MRLRLRLMGSVRPLIFLPALCGVPQANAQTAHPAFEVATVKPAPPGADPNTGSWSVPNSGHFSATHVTLELLIQLAYGVDKSQIANQPGWLGTNLYDIAAKPEDGVMLNRDELRPRLQELLQQRFHLRVHTEMRDTHGYALVVAKGGAHLTATKGDHFPGFRTNVSSGQMRGFNWSMPVLAKYLTSAVGFPVVDETGVAGSYDVAFSYDSNKEADPAAESNLPALGEALKEATGLMLKPQVVPVETIVVDGAEKMPTEN